MKNIKYIDNKEIKNITTSIKEEKGNEYIYEYKDNDKEKGENKKGLNIDEEWRGFLANNKDVKINNQGLILKSDASRLICPILYCLSE